MIRILAILLALLMLAVPALAQENAMAEPFDEDIYEPYIPFDDEAYVNEYFGTKLTVFMTERMIEDDNMWWPDELPEELFYDPAALIELVNAQRSANGTPLLDTNGWYIEPGWEEETDGGWEYYITFYQMRPSEAIMIFDDFGGADALFANGQFSYLPCVQCLFESRVSDLDDDFVLLLAQQEYKFDARKGLDELHAEVSDAFLKAYGGDVIVDLSMYGSVYHDGTLDLVLSAYAQLPAG
jgi:hypothetical protein